MNKKDGVNQVIDWGFITMYLLAKNAIPSKLNEKQHHSGLCLENVTLFQQEPLFQTLLEIKIPHGFTPLPGRKEI